VSHTLGVSDWSTFWRVTIPVAMPSLLSGVVMCWARALGEFGATIMFAGSFQGRTQTMPLAIYAALEGDLDAALALSAILVVVSFAALVVLRGAVGRHDRPEGWRPPMLQAQFFKRFDGSTVDADFATDRPLTAVLG